MPDFFSLIYTVALFVCLIFPGFLMGKAKRIQESAITTIANILSDIAMPALVFVKLLETEIKTFDLITILLCLLLPAVVLIVLKFIGMIFFNKKDESREYCAARFCSIFSNCGFLGIPLAAALFPSHPEVTVYVSMANVSSTFLLLTMGINILNGDGEKKKTNWLSALFRPVTFAIIIGFACSSFGFGKSMPYAITYFTILSQLTTPLSMTVLGYELSQIKVKQLLFDRRVYIVSLIKLVISPLIACIILLILKFVLGFEISEYLSAAMFITTAVSTAASASALARSNGIYGSFAACSILMNTLLCVVTFPILWLLFDIILI